MHTEVVNYAKCFCGASKLLIGMYIIYLVYAVYISVLLCKKETEMCLGVWCFYCHSVCGLFWCVCACTCVCVYVVGVGGRVGVVRVVWCVYVRERRKKRHRGERRRHRGDGDIEERERDTHTDCFNANSVRVHLTQSHLPQTNIKTSCTET